MARFGGDTTRLVALVAVGATLLRRGLVIIGGKLNSTMLVALVAVVLPHCHTHAPWLLFCCWGCHGNSRMLRSFKSRSVEVACGAARRCPLL